MRGTAVRPIVTVLALVLLFGGHSLIEVTDVWVGDVLMVVIVGLVLIGIRAPVAMRLDFEERALWLSTGRRRQRVATPGKSEVLRYTRVTRRAEVPMQAWLKPGGGVVRFDERRWDVAELDRLRRQLGLPLEELGRMTPRELFERNGALGLSTDLATPALIVCAIVALAASFVTHGGHFH